MYPHEAGREPFMACLALRNQLVDVLNLKLRLDIHELMDLMTKLKDEWDNVLIARQRALGARITEAYVMNSQEIDDFESYLNYLNERGIPQTELDSIFVETIQYSLGETING